MQPHSFDYVRPQTLAKAIQVLRENGNRAELLARGPKGTRTIPIDRFFKDPFTTALRSAELLTEIRVPKSKSRDGGAYLKLKRKTGDFATIGVAVQLGLDAKRNVAGVRIGL